MIFANSFRSNLDTFDKKDQMKTTSSGHITLSNDVIRPLRIVEITSTKSSRKSKTYIGWIDTGATNTVLSHRIVEELGFVPAGETNANTPTDQNRKVNLFTVKIKVPGTDGTEFYDSVDAIQSPVELVNCDVLVGLDILQKAQFVLDHRARIFTLSFFD